LTNFLAVVRIRDATYNCASLLGQLLRSRSDVITTQTAFTLLGFGWALSNCVYAVMNPIFGRWHSPRELQPAYPIRGQAPCHWRRTRRAMDRASETTLPVGSVPDRRVMRRTGGLRVCLTLVAVLTFLFGGPFLAWAHVEAQASLPLSPPAHPDIPIADPGLPSAQPISPVLLGAPLAFMFCGLMAIALARNRRRWRRGAALGLALALGVFTFGVAIHAVHHLSEPQKAAECPVFTASQHVTGAPTDTCELDDPALAVGEPSIVGSEAPTLTLYFRPAQPRAPPSCPA
jgi:hypothetical protein